MQASVSEPELVHFPPKYDVFGFQLPVGKGSGLGGTNKSSAKLEEVMLPRDWEVEPGHMSKSALFQSRREENLADLSQTSAAVKIRSVSELKGSRQVAELVTGSFHGKDDPGKKTRSGLLEQRRQCDLKSMQRVASDFVPPHVKFQNTAGIRLRGSTGSEGRSSSNNNSNNNNNNNDDDNNNTIDGTSSSSGSRTLGHLRPQTTALCGARAQVKEIIRDRPAAPGLGWRAEARSRTEVLMERKQLHTLDLEQAFQRAEENPKGPKVVKQHPRVPGPLSHIETDHHDFGRDIKKQFPGAQTRADLRKRRHKGLSQELEVGKQQVLSRKMKDTMAIVKPVLESAEPWWKLGRSASELSVLDEQQRAAAADFERRRFKLTEHPATSGTFKHEALQTKAKRKTVQGKISSQKPLPMELIERKPRANRFTDAVIEFRNIGAAPELDANGKKMRFDPGENQPLFSSFSSDNIFMDQRERERKLKLLKDELKREKATKELPRRTFLIPRNGEAQMRRNQSEQSISTRAKAQVRTGGFQHHPAGSLTW